MIIVCTFCSFVCHGDVLIPFLNYYIFIDVPSIIVASWYKSTHHLKNWCLEYFNIWTKNNIEDINYNLPMQKFRRRVVDNLA